jgi:DNA-binding transcriptional LysR family regulator
MVEFRHVRYFIAVAEERNFSRAAERLHMAQSPLSAAIRQLEHEVGAELLERSSRGVTTTPAGAAFLDHARRIIESVDGAIAAARRAAAGELGTLRIAFSWSARFGTLPALAQAFAAREPDVTVITQEMWNADMPRALRSAAIDLAISLCPERDGELTYELLRREPMVAVLPERHPLAGRAELDLGALREEPFLMFPRELAPRLYDAMLEVCRRGGFEPTIGRRSFHSVSDTGIIATAGGVTLAPRSVGGSIPAAVCIPLSDPEAVLETYLVWLQHTRSPSLDRFRDVARSVFELG